MSQNSRKFLFVIALGLVPSGAFAASNTWNGAGVGSNTGSDWGVAANYSGGTATFSTSNTIDFSPITTTGATGLTLSTTQTAISASALIISNTSSTQPTPEILNIYGDGSSTVPTTLTLAGNITVSSTSGSVLTLGAINGGSYGSDLVLALGASAVTVNYATNTNNAVVDPVLPVAVINAEITGSGSLSTGYSTYGTGESGNTPLVLTNPDSTFSGVITAVNTSYTSIANTNSTSSLGESGTLTFGTGGIFSYVGAGAQSSNRPEKFGSSSSLFGNYATDHASVLTLDPSAIGFYSSTAAETLYFGVSNGNETVFGSAITNPGASVTTSLTKLSSFSYYSSTGALTSGNGTGTLLLTNANTYTGATTIQAGTLQLGNGTSGNLINTGGTYSNLTFAYSGGTFLVDEASTITNQNMGTLTPTAGDGIVEEETAGTATLTFAGLGTRSTSATVNFVPVNNGSSIVDSIVVGSSSGVMGDAYFFNGANYAALTSGTVRAINYTAGSGDTGAVTTSGTTTEASTAYLQATGNITSQATATFTDINLSGTPNLTATGTVSVDGILKSGTGASTISGGTINAVTSGDEFVIRTDQATDTLTISTPIVGTGALTKSGAGTLILSGANTLSGLVSINGGTLDFGGTNAASELSTYYIMNINGGTLDSTSGNNTFAKGIGLTGPSTIQDDSGTLTLSGTLALGNNTAPSLANTLTLGGTGNIIVSGIIDGAGIGVFNGSSLIKAGTGTVKLTAANQFEGGTTVSGGVMDVTGAASSSQSSLTTTASTTATLTSVTGLAIGESVTGSVIPASDYITGINTTNKTITLNAAASAGTGVTLTFGAWSSLGGSDSLASSVPVYGGLLAINGGGTLDIQDTTQYASSLALGIASTSSGSTIQSTGGTGTLNVNNGVTVNGTGNTIASSISLAGNTTVNSSSSLANNGTITGTVGVNGTLTGAGTIRTGSLTSGYAVAAASGGNITPGGVQMTTTATGNLTIDPTNIGSSNQLLSVASSATLAAPELTFNLGASTSSSKLTVGAATAANIMNFNVGNSGAGSTVVSINDLTTGSLNLNTAYVVIQGNASTTFEDNTSTSAWTAGLTTFTGSISGTSGGTLYQINSAAGLSLLTNANANGNYFAANESGLLIYDPTNDSIDVDVVPEPGTWAMMLGGLAVLIGWQRRGRKNKLG